MGDNPLVVASLGHQGDMGPVFHGLRDHHVDRVAFGSPIGEVHSGAAEHSGGSA